MGNENHDPRTGEFSSGPGGGGSAGADRGRVDASRGLTPGAGTGGSAGTPLEIVDKLRAASTNNAAFDSEIARLAADRSVRTQEMKQIASGFLGHQVRASGRGDALKEITKRQALNARSDARARVIAENIKSW